MEKERKEHLDSLPQNIRDEIVHTEIWNHFRIRTDEMKLVKQNTMHGPKLLPNQTLDRGNFAFYNFVSIMFDQENNKEEMDSYLKGESACQKLAECIVVEQACEKFTGMWMKELQ